MSVVKHQHYVPQFYLRSFCDVNGQLHVYDKVQDKVYATSPRNVGGERYFYDCEEMASLLGDKQAIEKYLAALETALSPRIATLIERLRTNNFSRLHPETRSAISLFAAFQIVRSKEARITSRQIGASMSKFLSKHAGAEVLINEIQESMTDEQEKAAHCRRLLDLPSILKMASIIEGHIWTIKRQYPRSAFWTGDDPITKKENVIVPFRSNAGIASPGIEIHIPLSPEFLIGCYERKYFKRIQHLDGKILDLKDPENVPYYRQFQVRQSLRFIYSSDPDFSFAKEMCGAEPIWRDPERKRVATNHDD